MLSTRRRYEYRIAADSWVAPLKLEPVGAINAANAAAGDWQQCAPHANQTRLDQRAQHLALSSLLCLGRHTMTGLLATCGAQFQDWTASYRLFSRLRFDNQALFSGIRSACLAPLPQLIDGVFVGR